MVHCQLSHHLGKKLNPSLNSRGVKQEAKQNDESRKIVFAHPI